MQHCTENQKCDKIHFKIISSKVPMTRASKIHKSIVKGHRSPVQKGQSRKMCLSHCSLRLRRVVRRWLMFGILVQQWSRKLTTARDRKTILDYIKNFHPQLSMRKYDHSYDCRTPKSISFSALWLLLTNTYKISIKVLLMLIAPTDVAGVGG